jgi:hypothetical protein
MNKPVIKVSASAQLILDFFNIVISFTTEHVDNQHSCADANHNVSDVERRPPEAWQSKLEKIRDLTGPEAIDKVPKRAPKQEPKRGLHPQVVPKMPVVKEDKSDGKDGNHNQQRVLSGHQPKGGAVIYIVAQVEYAPDNYNLSMQWYVLLNQPLRQLVHNERRRSGDKQRKN